LKTLPKNPLTLAALFAGLLCCAPAFAGGLDSGTQAANTFKIWFYSFCGICAVIYLSWNGLELWAKKIVWADFGEAIAKVAGVGAVVVIAPWAWNLFIS